MHILKRKVHLILSGMVTRIFQKSVKSALGIALAMALFSTGVNAQPALPDIQGNWAEKPIQALIDQGVINGYPDQTFKPDQPITRGEFAKIAAKTFEYPASPKQLTRYRRTLG